MEIALFFIRGVFQMQKEIFQNVKESLGLISESIDLFRCQMFFEGSKRVNKLIKNAGNISDYIIKSERPEEEKHEWILILQTFLNAQENKDYILMADILERDMLDFLEKVQSSLLTEGYAEIDEYWEANMESLKQVNPFLYETILSDCENLAKQSLNVQYEPFLAITGQPTLKVHMAERTFCMHSTVNPEWEAKKLTKCWLEEHAEEYLIFGMGMGYHVKALLQANEDVKVTVLEYRIESLLMALTYLEWKDYITSGRLNIIYESDLLKLLQHIKQKKEESVLFVHYPSLECVEEPELKVILEDYFLTTSTMLELKKCLDRNFEYLQKQKFPSCDEVRDMFSQKKVVIVAGGPSVDDEVESMKKYRDELVILSVGTVARKLIAMGIHPDAIILTDPHEYMYHQVEKLDVENIPLLLLSTVSRSVVKSYKGPIYLIYQEGYEPAEKVAKECGYSTCQTGGSVTTTALDLSIIFGADKVILVGADMAYTNNRSHAGGVGYEERDFSDFRQVTSVDGGVVYATRILDIYRKWIERRISGLTSPVVYNTSRGARISGTIEAKLKDII